MRHQLQRTGQARDPLAAGSAGSTGARLGRSPDKRAARPWPEPRPVRIQMLELVGFAGRYDALALPASAAALPYNFLFVPGQAAILPLERRHNLVLQ